MGCTYQLLMGVTMKSQNNGLNEILEGLHEIGCATNERPKFLNSTKNRLYKCDCYAIEVKSAIQELVEDGLVEDGELYGDTKSLSYHEALGHNQALATTKQNLIKLGLIKENTNEN